jgi:hypothetical protein
VVVDGVVEPDGVVVWVATLFCIVVVLAEVAAEDVGAVVVVDGLLLVVVDGVAGEVVLPVDDAYVFCAVDGVVGVLIAVVF